MLEEQMQSDYIISKTDGSSLMFRDNKPTSFNISGTSPSHSNLKAPVPM